MNLRVTLTKNEALVLDLLQELNRQGRTIVMVTQSRISELTDRAIYLHHGKICKEEIHENKFVKLLAIRIGHFWQRFL